MCRAHECVCCCCIDEDIMSTNKGSLDTAAPNGSSSGKYFYVDYIVSLSLQYSGLLIMRLLLCFFIILLFLAVLVMTASRASSVEIHGESTLISLSDKIGALESKFMDLAQGLLAHLKNSNFQVERLTSCISLLPRSINIYVFPMWKKICKKVADDETLNSLFTILNMEIWNILDYKLLEHFIKKCGNQNLIREMGKYISELEKFKKGTLVVDFIECWEGHNREIPDYDEVKVKFDKHCLTLAQLDAFRKTLARKCIPSLLDYAGWIYYKHFQGGCFVVSWALPSQLVLLLKHHIRCMHRVLVKYGVKEVVLGGTVVYDHYKRSTHRGNVFITNENHANIFIILDRSYSHPNFLFSMQLREAVIPS